MGSGARRILRLALPLSLLVALSGCAVSSSSGSRHMLYNSLDELVEASSAIVCGSVVAQGPGPNGTTVNTVDVDQVFTPDGLGAAAREPVADVPPGSAVQVRTYEDANSSATPAGLEPGPVYLFFLVPTGLPDAKADEFFVTGSVAGIYELQGESYLRKVFDSDRLPGSITAEDLSNR